MVSVRNVVPPLLQFYLQIPFPPLVPLNVNGTKLT